MSHFTHHTTMLDAYWRSVILYGDNVASYKFALGQALLELAAAGRTNVTREELAAPYARAITTHLALEDRQTTSPSSTFLNACRAFNRGESTHDELIAATVRYGFNHVLRAFHTVNRAPITRQFFVDSGRGGGITLTDDLLTLREQIQFANLPAEVEARWRLVETAWGLKLPVGLIAVTYDDTTRGLVIDARAGRRIAITAARDALNGYQQGRCFYCFDEITVTPGSRQAEVDHFFPHKLKLDFRQIIIKGRQVNIDGVWNLVLACPSCNSGEGTGGGKGARVPEHRYLERLHTRNTYLIKSEHPLRETILNQTGATDKDRAEFLNQVDANAIDRMQHRWRPRVEHEGAFAAWVDD